MMFGTGLATDWAMLRMTTIYRPFWAVPARLWPEFGPALKVPQYTPQSPPKGVCVPVYNKMEDERTFVAADGTKNSVCSMAALLAHGDYDIEDVPVQPGMPADPRVAEKVGYPHLLRLFRCARWGGRRGRTCYCICCPTRPIPPPTTTAA